MKSQDELGYFKGKAFSKISKRDKIHTIQRKMSFEEEKKKTLMGKTHDNIWNSIFKNQSQTSKDINI